MGGTGFLMVSARDGGRRLCCLGYSHVLLLAGPRRGEVLSKRDSDSNL